MALKHSKQREMIKTFLMGRKDHPTADVVYMSVRQQNPTISLGTIYRNLTLLADLGEIQRLRLGDGVDHFDADTSPHYHFVCTECGSVIDLEMDSIEQITDIAGAGFDGGGYVQGDEQNEHRGGNDATADIIGLMGMIHGFKRRYPALPQNLFAGFQIVLQSFFHVYNLLSILFLWLPTGIIQRKRLIVRQGGRRRR